MKNSPIGRRGVWWPHLVPLLLLGVLLGAPVPSNAASSPYNGDWIYRYNPEHKPLPQLEFSLTLHVSGKTVTGRSRTVARYGAKIACSASATHTNIHGRVLADGSLRLNYRSFWSEKLGVAHVSRDGKRLRWRLTQPPQGVFYVPLTATLVASPGHKPAAKAAVGMSKDLATGLTHSVEGELTAAFDSCKQTASEGDMRACLTAELARQNRRLNHIWAQRLADLSPAKQSSLRGVERAWMAFRDANCAALDHPTGTAAADRRRVGCLLQMTVERADWLQSSAAAPIARAVDGHYRATFGQCVKRAGGVVPAMTRCLHDEQAWQDKQLNARYRQLMARLDTARRHALRLAERRWLKFRNRQVAFCGSSSVGQSVRVAQAGCQLRLTTRRRLQLDALEAEAS